MFGHPCPVTDLFGVAGHEPTAAPVGDGIGLLVNAPRSAATHAPPVDRMVVRSELGPHAGAAGAALRSAEATVAR